MRPKSNGSSTPRQIQVLEMAKCLAKTRRDANGEIGPGASVEAHSIAAFEVARQLLKYYGHFCTDTLWEEKCILLAPLLHDAGKISPLFQQKIFSALKEDFPPLISCDLQSRENHCITSFLTLNRLKLRNLAQIAASHHGSYCSSNETGACDEILGGEAWEALREEFVKKLASECGFELTDIPPAVWEKEKELILGLTILADWLSSGMDLKPDEIPTPEKCAETVKNAGFIPFIVRKDLTFSKLFKTRKQPGFKPNDVQKAMLENIQPGGVYILETEMGSGKTEAALALAYELLKSHRHAGIYFALPTQLTSNKIFDRFRPFLRNILDEGNRHLKALLLHSKAWLQNDLQNDGDEGEEGFQKEERKANSWFSSRKRGLLAPFAVGTIDQLLMAVINVRHGALRSLGVAGKVVILDEVHSYDDYTGTLIRELVERLLEWNCTVIILSATLTHELRNSLLGIDNDRQARGYPLLSIRGENEVFYHEFDQKKSKKVKILHASSIDQAYGETLNHAEKGECVLWIENTVGDAQKAFQFFTSHPIDGVEVGLIHSRFQEITRRRNENEWVEKYGKNATKEKRSGGKILVGTQVLEQSVDIDADFLVTRLCPTDMLLQRIGRLWRHESLNEFRPPSARCEVLILKEAPFQNREKWSDYDKTPPVYAPYFLMRSQEVFENRDEIVIPRDMRELMESTYSEREETDWYAHLKRQFEEKRQQLRRLADLSKGSALPAQPDTEASTRYSEKESVEVLLLKEFHGDQIQPFGSDGPIKIPPKNATKEECTRCARILSQYLVRVYIDKAPGYSEYPLDTLSHILYIGSDNKNRPLRAAFVGDGGILQNQSRFSAESEDSSIQMGYSARIGYFYERKENK